MGALPGGQAPVPALAMGPGVYTAALKSQFSLL